MDELISKSENPHDINGLSEEDIEKYAKNLSEYQELKILESQFNFTASELNEAKNQLSSVEKEIKLLQEEKNSNEKRSAELLASAKKFHEDENYDAALEAYYEVLEIFPKHIRALTSIQRIKKEKKEKEDEQREADQKARKNAEEAMNFFESGKRFYRMTNYEKALDEFLAAVTINGKNSDIMEYIEKCENKIHEVEEAMNIAKKENEQKRKTVNELSMQANSFIRKKDFSKAIELFEKALLIMPDNLEIKESLKHADIAFSEFNAENLKIRQEEERLASEKLHSKIDMLNKVANDFIAEGYFEKALSYYEQIASLDSSNVNAEAGIFRCLAEMKKEEENKNRLELEKERKINEEVLLYMESGKHFYKIENYEKALEAFYKVVSIKGKTSEVLEYIEKCENKIRESEEVLNIAKKENEQKLKTVNELSMLANSYVRKKEFAKAIELFEKALLIIPENMEVKESLKIADIAFNEFQNENFKLKQEEEKISLEKLQSKIDMLKKVADDFITEGYFEKALSYYEQIISLDSYNIAAESGIYKCTAEMKKEEENKNRLELEKERKINEEVLLYMESGKHFYKIENYEKALEAFYKVVSIKGKTSEVLEYIEKCENKIREIEEVLNIAKKENEQKVKTVNELFILGKSHIRKNEFSKAIELFEKALLIMPDNVEIKDSLKQADIALHEQNAEILKNKQEQERTELEKRNVKIQILNKIASDFIVEGYYEKALSYYEQIVSLDSSNVNAEAGIFKCTAEMKKEEENKNRLVLEEERKKEIEEVCFCGKILFEEGNFKEALKKWEYALTLDIYNDSIKNEILKVKNILSEIDFCEEVKLHVIRYYKTEEKKFNDLKNLIENGLMLLSQKRHKEVLILWRDIYSKNLSEGHM